MFTYTSYKPHFHDAIQRLGEAIFEDDASHQIHISLRDAIPESIVVLHHRRVVGFALLAHTRFFGRLDAMELSYLVVHPDYQGKGIGSTLLQKVKEINPIVVLEVSYFNPDAERLYSRHGFNIWRNMYTKATGGYLMGWSKQRHERILRLRSHQSPPQDGTEAPLTTHRP